MEDHLNNSLCPSYAAKTNSQLFGVVNSEGFITYLNESIPVNESFLESASHGRAPEKRFRFAGKCSKSGCNQWNGVENRCGLINTIISIVNNKVNLELQHCSIRSKCRWYAQEGALACAQCNEVIRNIEIDAVEISSL